MLTCGASIEIHAEVIRRPVEQFVGTFVIH